MNSAIVERQNMVHMGRVCPNKVKMLTLCHVTVMQGCQNRRGTYNKDNEKFKKQKSALGGVHAWKISLVLRQGADVQSVNSVSVWETHIAS